MQIRPVSDLRNNFTGISKELHESGEPIFLTKNGYGDMVVMSMETYHRMQTENEITMKLLEAEREARDPNTKWIPAEKIFDDLLEKYDGK